MNLKIASISSELSPFSKSGGLGDVARSLPLALKNSGQDIFCITPFYSKIINPKKHNLKLIKKNINLKIDSENNVLVNFWVKDDTEVKTYFIENKEHFGQEKKIYGLGNDNLRFLIFDFAALKLIELLESDTQILHCHDWHTGLIPFYLKQTKKFESLKSIKTIFTIHNLIFQLGRNWWEISSEKKDKGKAKLPKINNEELQYINFAKRAILNADIVNTVSENYRNEILTKHFGQDLHKILKKRQNKLFGIINGISHKLYSPEHDEKIAEKYNLNNFSEAKAINKIKLQEIFKLPVKPNTPIICSTSRITFQKGFSLIVNILEHLLKLDLQIIILGAGDENYIQPLKKLEKKYRKKLAVAATHEDSQKYETMCYAGSDFIMLPSHHEPCGLNQLIAMRYGSVPIARTVGGLHDTVENYNIANKQGTGFSFFNFNEFELYGAIVKALEIYKEKELFGQIISSCLQKSSDWTLPAQKYTQLYEKAFYVD